MQDATRPHPGPTVGRFWTWIARGYLRFRGWRLEGMLPEHPQCVFIAAPHTSSWDMSFTILTAWALGVKPNWGGRRSLFRWPWGFWLRVLGGVPVDRRGNQGMVERLAALFERHERLYLGIAPSGARRYTEYWRSGFYHVARRAGVPIYFGYLDYDRRVCGIGGFLVPSGDLCADMDRIRAFYEPIGARIPANKSRIRLRDEEIGPEVQAVGRG